VGPGSGELADGDVGEGRLADPPEIAGAAARLLGPRDLSGRLVLVTAGPTREHLDPVRYLSNPSTGKMGYEVARAAARRGADVVLVSGPTTLGDPAGVRVVRVSTAEEMAAAVLGAAGAQDLLVAAAAVSDYRPRNPSASKKKKGDGPEVVELERTTDILATLGERLAGSPGAPVLVGFAAETEDVVGNAREKLRRKRCDLVVANAVGVPGAGFGGDRNQVSIVGPDRVEEVEGTKRAVADAILDRAVPLLDSRRPRP
jgi:phosphopantothenoylcysteine decarboxylase/phosphopantothenate--cysteine ligase